MEGYKVDAFRFLLKSNSNMQRHITECMDAIRKKMEYDVIWKDFEFHEGKKKLSMDCLLYIESNLHKLLFYVMEDEILTYTLNDTLNHVERSIDSKHFLRCHQSFLVNMKYIKKINRYEVILYNNKSLPIPKARYREVYDTYVAYKREL